MKSKLIHKAKFCTQCGVLKGLIDFSKNSNSRDGKRPNCKKCQSVREQHLINSDERLFIKQLNELIREGENSKILALINGDPILGAYRGYRLESVNLTYFRTQYYDYYDVKSIEQEGVHLANWNELYSKVVDEEVDRRVEEELKRRKEEEKRKKQETRERKHRNKLNRRLNKKGQKQTYLMKDKSKPGIYKIGKSVNPTYREKTLESQTPYAENVKVWKENIEDILHNYYDEYRVRGEWFKLTPIQVRYICTTDWIEYSLGH